MQTYRIGQLAKLTGHSTHTLRYYEKETLLYDVIRDAQGHRLYTEKDVELIQAIDCLKETGMSIQKIKYFIDIFRQGHSSYKKRVSLFQLQKEEILKKKKKLEDELAMAEYKIWYYQNITPEIEDDPLHCQKMKKEYNKIHRL